MFDVADFIDAARCESDDRLRVTGAVACSMRDAAVARGDHIIAEFFNTVMDACVTARAERKAMGVEIDTAIAESLGVTVWPATREPDDGEQAV
jgi:hypothetical protein